MERLQINNFGPVQNINLNVNDFLVFIGPQASGKSTISKSIYFFKSLRDDLFQFVLECLEKRNFQKAKGSYTKKIRTKFLDFWGPTYEDGQVDITYYYTEDIYIKITIRGIYVNPEMSPHFISKFNNLINKAMNFSNALGLKNPAFMSSNELMALESEKRIFYQKIEEIIFDIFQDNRDFLYIPAGRSLLSVLSDQLQNVHPRRLDYLMRKFIDRINNSKTVFSKSLKAIVQEKKSLTQERVDHERVSLAEKIIFQILKGDYQYDSKGGERLYFDKSRERYTKLSYSSSGQQEAIWILLQLFVMILDRKNFFVVIEEPEAHLYPEAQKEIVELISLLANSADNKIILTTHSPYVLSAINNLLYAGNLAKKNSVQISKIVDKKLWLDHSKVGVYFVNKNEVSDIVDRELNLIKVSAIDSASAIINRIYDQLFEVDE